MLKAEDIVVKQSGSLLLQASFELEEGSFTSVIGPSGAGKSTLVQALAGFTPLHSGRVKKGNTEIQDLPPSQRDFAIVFQNETLFDHLTVLGNLKLALHDKGYSAGKSEQMCVDMITELELPENYAKKHPSQLSGGEKARVAIARALLRGSSWLVLDEAFAALDERLRLELGFWLEKLQKARGLTILQITHSQQEARLFSTALLALVKGKVVYHGAPNGFDEALVRSGLVEHFTPTQSRLEREGQLINLAEVSLTKPESPESWEVFKLRQTQVVHFGERAVLRERDLRTLIHLKSLPPETPQQIWAKRGHEQT